MHYKFFHLRDIFRSKLLVAFGLLALTSLSRADIIWIDHNDQIANLEAKWNVLASPPASATAVVDADGNDDGVTVSYSGFGDSGSERNHTGALATTVWEGGAADYFFVGDSSTGTITIAGLQDSEVYTLRLIGAADNGSAPRAGDYQVNGSFGDGASPNNGDDYEAHTDGFDNGEVMTWTGVTPSSGVITITMADPSGGDNSNGTAHFNAFSIEGDFVGGNTFADWIAGFPVGGLDGFDDDADGDNLDNSIEAWFGTNPAEGNAGLTQISKVGTVFSFQHPEADTALSDVVGSYEWSIDLNGWNSSGTVGDTSVTITATPNDPVAGTTTVEADTTGSTVAPTKLFIRAVATQN